MIGSADGKQYESQIDFALGRPVEAPEKPAGASKSDPGTQVAQNAPNYLQSQRARFGEELKNPQTRAEMRAILSMEHEGDPTAPAESLMNRMSMTGGSLHSGIHGGFYGPVNKGLLPGRMEELSRNPKRSAKLDSAIDEALAGSNYIKGATDQGSGKDPNVAWPGGKVVRFGETYNDWGGAGGHAASQKFREEQQKNVAAGAPYIDRNHDVPLAASALHKDGNMYGVAIDKDAPIRPEYDQYIHKHEADEFAYMKDLIKTGMEPTEAYHKAHDHITPMESARVQADLGEKGLEDYKQYWRDVASVSTKKENPDRHPDAHTTTYGLDEAELSKKYQPSAPDYDYAGAKAAGVKPDKRGHYPDTYKLPNHITFSDESKYNDETHQGGHWKELGKDKWEFTPGPQNLKTHSIQELKDYFKKYEPNSILKLPDKSETGRSFPKEAMFRGVKGYMTANDADPEHPPAPNFTHQIEPPIPGGSSAGKWFQGGEGKWRQEISDAPSKLTLDKASAAIAKGKTTTLGDVLHHPELYKSYPELKDIKVVKDDTKHLNSAYTVPGKIVVGPMESEEMLHSILLHEIQHPIQTKEGFSKGSAQQVLQPYVMKALQKVAHENPDLKPTSEEFADAVYEAYWRVAGEVEARNVQYRHKHPEAAKMFSPELTEDVPRSKQLNAP